MTALGTSNLVHRALFWSILSREWRLLFFGALSISLGLALAIGVRFAVMSPSLSFEKRLTDIESNGWAGPIQVRSFEAEQALQSILGHFSWVELAQQTIDVKVTNSESTVNPEETKQILNIIYITDGRFNAPGTSNTDVEAKNENAAWIPENSCIKSLAPGTKAVLETDVLQFHLGRIEQVKTDKFPIFENCNTVAVFVHTFSLQNWIDLNLAESKSLYMISDGKSFVELSERLAFLAEAIPGFSYANSAARVSRLQSLSASFDLNLQIMGLISLVVGAFMVYQVMSLLLARYASHFAILHSQGVSFKKQFTPLFLLVCLLALFATLLGTFMAYGFASFISRYTGEAVRNLYESLVPTNAFRVQQQDLLLALVYGFGSSLAGAFGALLRLFGLDSAQVLRTGAWHGLKSSLRHRNLAPLAHALLLLVCLSLCLLAINSKVPEPLGSKVPYGGLGACFALLIVNVYICRAGHFLLAPLRKWLPELPIFLSAKSALITQVLGLAFCLAIGVKTMSESFRASLLTWTDATMSADIWLRNKLGPSSPISQESFEAIKAFVSQQPSSQMDVLYRLTADWQLNGSQESQPIIINVNRFAIHKHHQPLKFLNGRPTAAELERILENGKNCQATRSSPCPAFVSESACIHASLSIERCASSSSVAQAQTLASSLQSISLQNKRLWFQYYKVFQDFNDTGTVQVDENVARRLFVLPARPFFVNVYFSKSIPSLHKAGLIDDLKKRLGLDSALDVFSLQEIKRGVIKTFEETFRITDALYLVCIMISFVTVLSSLYLQFIVRKLDWSVLWACVYSRSQIAARLAFYSGIQAAAAVLLSAPGGYGIAWILVKIINKRAFGFSLDFVPGVTVVVALAAAATVTGALGTLLVTRKLLGHLSASNLNLE